MLKVAIDNSTRQSQISSVSSHRYTLYSYKADDAQHINLICLGFQSNSSAYHIIVWYHAAAHKQKLEISYITHTQNVETAMSYPITYSNVGRHNISGEGKKIRTRRRSKKIGNALSYI